MKETLFTSSDANVFSVKRSVSASSISSSMSQSSPLSPQIPSTSDSLTTAALCAAVAATSSHKKSSLTITEDQHDGSKELTDQALIGLSTMCSRALPPVTCASERKNKQHDLSGESSQEADTQVFNPSQPLCESSTIMPNSSPQHFQNTDQTTVKERQQLRRGKWTKEEEEFVARAIQDFNSGYLNAPAGTTLRTYLSEKLNCDPMRITKKFTGDACIGKRVFHPAARCAGNGIIIDKAQTELDILEKKWRKRLETQQKDSSKRSHRSASNLTALPNASVELRDTIALEQNAADQKNQDKTVVAQAATWLDRAGVLLSSRPHSDVETQMRQVEELIHEGPLIQKSSAILSKQVASTETPNTAVYRSASEVRTGEETPSLSVHSKIQDESLPTKRKVQSKDQVCNEYTLDRIGGHSNADLLEKVVRPLEFSHRPPHASGSDAEALVGFLNSLRNETNLQASDPARRVHKEA